MLNIYYIHKNSSLIHWPCDTFARYNNVFKSIKKRVKHIIKKVKVDVVDKIYFIFIKNSSLVHWSCDTFARYNNVFKSIKKRVKHIIKKVNVDVVDKIYI